MKINRPYEKENGPLVGLVSTPIGNIEDITLRALNFLKQADIIACEDTRNTAFLLSHYNIVSKRLVSLYAQTEVKQSMKLIDEIKANNLKMAYCSDAGMPGISDPGSLLVLQCYQQGIPVTILPGPTASLSALVLSSFDSSDFSFFGFLPTKQTQLENFLSNLIFREETLIFYESPKRLIDTLNVMKNVFSPKREVAVVRELTKEHEEVIKGTLEEITKTNIIALGECVIVVKGVKRHGDDTDAVDEEKLITEIKGLLREGEKTSNIAKKLSSKYKLKKKVVYQLVLDCEKTVRDLQSD